MHARRRSMHKTAKYVYCISSPKAGTRLEARRRLHRARFEHRTSAARWSERPSLMQRTRLYCSSKGERGQRDHVPQGLSTSDASASITFCPGPFHPLQRLSPFSSSSPARIPCPATGARIPSLATSRISQTSYLPEASSAHARPQSRDKIFTFVCLCTRSSLPC
jgi:hypothetical protein